MKRILKENMMRFGTKNLNEQGNSEFDPGGHYYVPQDDEIIGTDIGDTKTIKNTAVLSIENNRCVFVVSVGANDNTVRLIPVQDMHSKLICIQLPTKLRETKPSINNFLIIT